MSEDAKTVWLLIACVLALVLFAYAARGANPQPLPQGCYHDVGGVTCD